MGISRVITSGLFGGIDSRAVNYGGLFCCFEGVILLLRSRRR